MKERCLLPSSIDALQEELQRQHISIQKFFLDENVDPQQREAILTSALGSKENADFFVDTVYDEIITPLLQRNAVKALEKEGLKQNVVEDMVLNRIRRLQGRMSPEYENMYLEKLVQEDMKMALSQEQSETLVEAQNSVDAALEDLNNAMNQSGKFDGKSFKDLYKEDDINKIKEDDNLYQKYLTLGLSVVKYNKTYSDIAQSLLETGAGAVAKKIVGSTRSAILSADLGFGRNISNMFFISPKTGFKSWWKGAVRSVQDFWYGKETDKNGYTKQDYAWAEIYAHPNVISGRLKQLGINIGITEEPFLNSYITQLTEKSEEASRDKEASALKRGAAFAARPILRLYASSESGFNMAVNYARFTYANMMIDLYDAKTKQDIKKLKENGIGDLIMEQTGRWNGLKGSKEVVDKLSFYMMAMRWTASRIATVKNIIYAPAAIADIVAPKGVKTLDASYFNKRNVDKGRSAVGIVFGMATFAALLSAALSEDDEKDYWERFLDSMDVTKDYGKVVFGKTRFDVTFGIAPVITTVAKTIKNYLYPTYGNDVWDPGARFFKNRQAPIISIIVGSLEHARATIDETFLPTDIIGEPETFSEFIRGITLPIYVDSIIEYTGEDKDPDVSTLEASAAILSDVIGISATTYSKKATKSEIVEKWGAASPLAQIGFNTTLYKELPRDEFKQASKEMSDLYMQKATNLINSPSYNSMSREEKDKVLQKLHTTVMNEIKEKHGLSRKKKKYGLK